MKFEDHPAAAIFPLLPEEELEELSASIKRNGQRHPIILFQGKVVDGRNRLRACELAGIEPRTEIYDPERHGSSILQFIVDENLRRRQLTASQRALIQAQALRAFQAEAERAAKATPTPTPPAEKAAPAPPAKEIGGGAILDDEDIDPKVPTMTPETEGTVPPADNIVAMPSQEEAARLAGVSTRTMGAAVKVAGDAKKSEEVASGKKSVSQAAAELSTKEAEDARRKLLKRIRTNCGEPFAQAFLDKEVLKTIKETAAFMALDDDTMAKVAPLVVTGWKVARAAAHVKREVSGKSTVDDLMNWTIAEGGTMIFKFNGFEFAVTRLETKPTTPPASGKKPRK